jgi:hypothetical protein
MRHGSSVFAFFVAAFAAGLVGPACSSEDQPAAPPGGGDGGADVADTGRDGSVDPCIETPSAAECLNEETAMFVSAAASAEGAEGSRAKPFKTIHAALGAVTAERKRIYICEGTYPEDLALGAAHSGVSLLGGVACDWNPSDNKPVLGQSASPLRIDDANGLALVDLAVHAKDATEGSSIAAFVHGGSVTFKGVSLVAGKGAKGKDGELVPFTFPAQADLKGNDAADGGETKSVTCPGGAVTTGGKGGKSGFPGEKGTPGTNDNGGILGQSCAGTGTGSDGAEGTNAAVASGAAAHGSLADSGWMASNGGNGEAGPPGQGGGGGAGNAGDGGGGGAGGCGGAGGPGGKGGGASIALAVHEADVTLTDSQLRASDAGTGGKGAAGQTGQSEFGFRGNGSGAACQGGNGGPGGAGGAGGGGAGGVSTGVLYKGPKPTLDTATENAITVGAKGDAGAGGAASNAGRDGDAKPILEAP